MAAVKVLWHWAQDNDSPWRHSSFWHSAEWHFAEWPISSTSFVYCVWFRVSNAILTSVILLSVTLMNAIVPALKCVLPFNAFVWTKDEKERRNENILKTTNKVMLQNPALIRTNQLPDSVARWQRGSQIYVWQLYFLKSHKIANNSTTAEDRVKINTNLESLEF